MIASLAPALLMGLFGGAHCVVMCGGISSVLCGSAASAKSAPTISFAYNAGRVVSYAALGLAVGALGSLGASLDGVKFAFRAAAAVCMLAVGLHLAGLPSFVRGLESLGAPLWRKVAPLARRVLPLRSPWQALAAGLVWALMPCGLLYGALALAISTGSALEGGATMAAFGIGTLPVMVAVGLVAGRVAHAMARVWVRRLAGAVVLAFGLWSTAGLAQQVGIGEPSHACCPTP